MKSVMAAVVQMNSQAQVEDNLIAAAELIARAAAAGAELVLLPEYFYCMAHQDSDRVALAEPWAAGRLQRFCQQQARQHGLWLLAGTLPLAAADADKFYNASLLFNPEGEVVMRYDKCHLFDFDNGEEAYRESDTQTPGQQRQSVELPWGILRPSICYDLRFPEFYRAAPAADLISVPAAFTATTGAAHWLALLKARAIENQAFVLAAGQVGLHANGKRTFGHSVILDPWGEVLARVEGDQPGIAVAQLDAARLEQVRQQLPALKHRRALFGS
ncbi:carbon-nitrogen hydrolase family protein [Balneatrix alpica]|uniref:carbon-nitrogen hydrolase family protein n=1 Tax=Balneatrix alpica TaxID=75684 RepID=UPI0027395B44|nr:carbon-nitrogen hydrolase family protein [Balneatrix alpica]